MSKSPNFFIVGAPKCGTTALAQALAGHPRVFFSDPKEPEFFASDLAKRDDQPWRSNRESYFQLFEKVGNQHSVVAEGSVMYMFSDVAIQTIREFNPEARLAVMLRHPLELLPSFHNHMLFDFHEDRTDFEEAWRLQSRRARGEAIPTTCRKPQYLQYRKVGSLGEQLKRVYQHFPRGQVFVGFYDDFCRSPRSVYLSLLAFLGLDDDGREDFPRANHKKHHRWRAISQLRRQLPDSWQRGLRSLRSSLADKGLGKPLAELNTVRKLRKPLSDEFRVELAAAFHEDTQELASLVQLPDTFYPIRLASQ